MKRFSFLLPVIVILLSMTMLHTTNASAKVYMGKITLQVGKSYSVSAVPTSGYTASGYWSKSNSNFVITASGSYSCTIKGNTVGTGTLSYWGSVAPSNSWNTYIYDYYWDVEVKGDDGGSSGGGTGSNTDEFDEIQEPTDDWGKSGNYSISWYNKNKTEFTISTNKELAGMAYLVNNGYTEFENCTIILADDINLSDKKWIACKNFKGTFDGQGHSINGVFIGTDEANQLNFGFWRKISKAKIVNLRLDGTAKYYTKESTSKTEIAGGMVGEVTSSSLIQNCIVNMDIYFRRGQVGKMYPGSGLEKQIRSQYTGSYVGGIVGWLSGSIKNCINLGSVRYYVRDKTWVSQGLCLGGIAGSSYTDTEIEYCENLSPLIKVVESNVTQEGYDYFKWISGICYSGKIVCCRSVIDEIYVDVTSHIDTPILNLSGISTTGTSTNCYSVIPLIILKTSYSRPKIYYGGISGHINWSSEPTACFSNNDTYVSMDISRTVENGRNGSNAFSVEQMKTSAFLEELNMYSTLEMDGSVWTQGNNGGYPYIAELYQTTDIKVPKAKEAVSEQSVFTISGQRLEKPRKGINIIGGKKVVVR